MGELQRRHVGLISAVCAQKFVKIWEKCRGPVVVCFCLLIVSFVPKIFALICRRKTAGKLAVFGPQVLGEGNSEILDVHFQIRFTCEHDRDSESKYTTQSQPSVSRRSPNLDNIGGIRTPYS